MEKLDAIDALAGLAQDTRLDIFRLLVAVGPEGLPAGRIGARLGVAPATLSFHLHQMRQAGLLRARRAGRLVIYAADFGTMRALLDYLMEDCCAGHPEVCGLARARAPDLAPSGGGSGA